MPEIKFSKKEVADKFDNLAESDITIHRAGYSGKLSNIPLRVAEQLVNAGYANIKAKTRGTGKPDPTPQTT